MPKVTLTYANRNTTVNLETEKDKRNLGDEIVMLVLAGNDVKVNPLPCGTETISRTSDELDVSGILKRMNRTINCTFSRTNALDEIEQSNTHPRTNS